MLGRVGSRKDRVYPRDNKRCYNLIGVSIMREKNELDYTCGISDDELTERFKESIRIDEEIRRIKGLPTSGYDKDKGKAYIIYPDGRREYIS